MVLRNVAKTFSLEEQRQEINEIAVDLDAVNTTLTNWNAANWDTAYSWGDHAQAGYYTAGNNIKLNDEVKLIFGTGDDLQIRHTGATSFITQVSDIGDLYIVSLNDDNDVVIQTDDGSGNTVDYFRADGSTGESILSHYGSTKLATKSTGVDISGDIVVSGNVDGRDVASDGTKLDGIETGATADQTGAEIKTAYEGEADTNAFTDAEQTKLAGIETGATVNAATGGTSGGLGTQADPQYGSVQFRGGTNTLLGDSVFVYETTNNRLSIGQTVGGTATLNVVTPGATSVDTAYFYASESGADNRIRINTVANLGGDPYIKFDAGGSNMIVGEYYQGTTDNQLLMGVGESPSGGVIGFGVDGDGKTWSGTHVDGNGQFTIRNNVASRYTNFELTGDSTTNYRMIKASGKFITRGTVERNIDIVASRDSGTNINQMVQVTFHLNSAVTNHAGKITFQAGCHRNSGGNFTFWTTTPQVTMINGSGYGAGTVSWVGAGTNDKTLRYVTGTNVNYTNFMHDIIVTGYDNANFDVL